MAVKKEAEDRLSFPFFDLVALVAPGSWLDIKLLEEIRQRRRH